MFRMRFIDGVERRWRRRGGGKEVGADTALGLRLPIWNSLKGRFHLLGHNGRCVV